MPDDKEDSPKQDQKPEPEVKPEPDAEHPPAEPYAVMENSPPHRRKPRK